MGRQKAITGPEAAVVLQLLLGGEDHEAQGQWKELKSETHFSFSIAQGGYEESNQIREVYVLCKTIKYYVNLKRGYYQ